jgi:hypothetical protein
MEEDMQKHAKNLVISFVSCPKFERCVELKRMAARCT